jgi:putative NIF3 family GTP cyclohydrolase 1 type 2
LFGAGSFRDRDSLVITGELKHHDALELLRRGITAVCLGHYASERPVLDAVLRELARRVPAAAALIAGSDAAPLRPLRG